MNTNTYKDAIRATNNKQVYQKTKLKSILFSGLLTFGVLNVATTNEVYATNQQKQDPYTIIKKITDTHFDKNFGLYSDICSSYKRDPKKTLSAIKGYKELKEIDNKNYTRINFLLFVEYYNKSTENAMRMSKYYLNLIKSNPHAYAIPFDFNFCIDYFYNPLETEILVPKYLRLLSQNPTSTKKITLSEFTKLYHMYKDRSTEIAKAYMDEKHIIHRSYETLFSFAERYIFTHK